MPSGYQPLRVYQELADWYERQAQAQLRDRFLLLAADAALSGGQADEAERLRVRLLQQSPHHMLKPFASFAEATRSPDVQGYLSDLRQTYPPEAAAEMLASLRGGESGPPEAPPAAPPPELPPPPTRTSPPPTRATEPLKVYRVREENAAADAPPRNAPPPRPGPTRKTVPPPPAPPPRPAPRSVPPTALPPTAAVPLPPVASAPPPRRAPIAPPVAVAPPPARPAAPIPIADAPPARPLPLPRGDLRPKATDPEPPPDRGSAWVSVALFVLVLTAGLALTVWTLGRPFFPPGWLP